VAVHKENDENILRRTDGGLFSKLEDRGLIYDTFGLIDCRNGSSSSVGASHSFRLNSELIVVQCLSDADVDVGTIDHEPCSSAKRLSLLICL
jgi:hypothetical protein